MIRLNQATKHTNHLQQICLNLFPIREKKIQQRSKNTLFVQRKNDTDGCVYPTITDDIHSSNDDTFAPKQRIFLLWFRVNKQNPNSHTMDNEHIFIHFSWCKNYYSLCHHKNIFSTRRGAGISLSLSIECISLAIGMFTLQISVEMHNRNMNLLFFFNPLAMHFSVFTIT